MTFRNSAYCNILIISHSMNDTNANMFNFKQPQRERSFPDQGLQVGFRGSHDSDIRINGALTPRRDVTALLHGLEDAHL